MPLPRNNRTLLPPRAILAAFDLKCRRVSISPTFDFDRLLPLRTLNHFATRGKLKLRKEENLIGRDPLTGETTSTPIALAASQFSSLP